MSLISAGVGSGPTSMVKISVVLNSTLIVAVHSDGALDGAKEGNDDGDCMYNQSQKFGALNPKPYKP